MMNDDSCTFVKYPNKSGLTSDTNYVHVIIYLTIRYCDYH